MTVGIQPISFPAIHTNLNCSALMKNRWLGYHAIWVTSKIKSENGVVSLAAKVWSAIAPIMMAVTIILLPFAIRLQACFKEAKLQAERSSLLDRNEPIPAVSQKLQPSTLEILEDNEKLKSKVEFNSLETSFFENEKLKDFVCVLNKSSSMNVRDYLILIGKDKRLELVNELILRYKGLFKWMEKMSGREENDLFMQEEYSISKGKVVDEVYGLCALAVYEIVKNFPELFMDKIRPVNPICLPREFHRCTQIMPKGMSILFDSAKEKKRFAGAVVICESYQDYCRKLKDYNDLEGGNGCFIIRCKDDEKDHEPHISTVIVHKTHKQTQVFVLDSGGIFGEHPLKKFILELSQLTHEIIPDAKINTTFLTRQVDGFNCGTIAFKGVKAFDRLNSGEFLEFDKKSISTSICIPRELDSIPLKANPILPVSLIKTMQSLSSLDDILGQLEGEHSEQVEHLKRLRKTFVVRDPRMNKDLYYYTKMHGLRNRLEIIARIFAMESSLVA